MGLGLTTSTPSAFAEASSSSGGPGRRRRRPTTFGAAVPHVTQRGLARDGARDAATSDDLAEREGCPLCRKFGAGPCGDVFRRWLTCTDRNPGKNAAGEPRHLVACADFAEKLAGCLEAHADHYANSDEEHPGTEQKEGARQEAWTAFAEDMAEGIADGTFDLRPYPDALRPNIQVRSASRTGAAYFVPEQNGDMIVAAYILDENGSVVAAGSKEDMDMGQHGCVLQFEVADGMTSATAYAVYDTPNGHVLVFSQRIRLPADQRK